MIPQYADLQYFLKICETLNVSRASEKLGMAQSTISQALKRLEDTVGSQLFIRRKNGLELTRAGQVLRTRAGSFVDQWRSLTEEAGSSESVIKGPFSIGAHVSVATYALPQFLPKLTKNYPELRLSLVHGSSSEVLESIISSRLDFGLIINPKRHPDLVIKSLGEDNYGLWRTKQSNEDLLILNPHVPANDIFFSKIRGKYNFSRTLETTSFEVAAQLVSVGTGIGLLPERVAKLYDLEAFHKELYSKDTLCLCYRRDRQKSAGSKAIIDSIAIKL